MPCNCPPPFPPYRPPFMPRPEPFSPLPRRCPQPDPGAWIKEQLAKKYEKPGDGIPKTDLAEDVQASLDKAGSAYVKPGDGIPKTDLAEGVQASLDNADTAVQPAAIAGFVDGAKYDAEYGDPPKPAILLKHGSEVVAAVDAADFVIDGMVSDVRIVNGSLVITFNTDSGKQPISIPLTDIFDPANYYTKTDVNGLLAGKQDALTFDATPTAGSLNPVTSGGIKDAIDAATPEDYAQVKAQVQTNTGDIADLKAVVPSAATAQNQLADKAFVNSSIATNTANFLGTYSYVTDLGFPQPSSAADVDNAAIATALGGLTFAQTPTNNDYVFVSINYTPTTDVDEFRRFKFNSTTGTWAYEYMLNNSSFTAAQWAAINSGITSGLVAKLGALPTAEALAQALAGKQDALTFDNAPTSGSNNPVKSGGIWSAIWGALSALPTGFTSLYDWVVDQLAGKEPLFQASTASGATIKTVAAIVKDGSLLKPINIPTSGVTVNGNALSSDVTLTGADIAVSGTDATKIDAALAGKADSSSIAAAFDASRQGGYAVGDVVMYNGVRYRCTTAHTGAWDAADFEAQTVEAAKQSALSDAQLANIAAVSDALSFDAMHSYAAGDPVVYNGTLYTFTAAHTGAWTGTDVSAVNIIARLAGKADKVAYAANGNLAALDDNGNLKDSNNTVQGTFGCGELVVGYSPDQPNQRYVDIIAQGAVIDHCTIIVYNSDSLGNYHYIALPNSDGADKESIFALEHEIAPSFDDTATYAEGALVYYNDALYRCTTAVTSAGAWTGSTNWTSASVEDVLAALRTAIAGKANRAPNPTAGNLAALDASGNPMDSQIPAANVALKGNIPYDLVTKTISNNAVTLDDRAANAVTISTTLSPNTLTINFPTATSGKVRDFAMRLNIAAGATAPEIAWPQGVTLENDGGEVPEIADGGTGGSSTILYFSETENDGTTAKFLVKGEALTAITQA